MLVRAIVIILFAKLYFYLNPSFTELSRNEWIFSTTNVTNVFHVVDTGFFCFKNSTNYYFSQNYYCANNVTDYELNKTVTRIEPSKFYYYFFKLCELFLPIVYSLITYVIIIPLSIFMVIAVLFPKQKTDVTNKGNSSQDIISKYLTPHAEITVHDSFTIFERMDSFIGCANVKKEIQTIINFLKYEKIYAHSRCKLVKGILLSGASGCGKTHLARIIAGEIGMNFICKSGSDFVQLYVGSGSLNVSQLFKTARKNKPCLIFIDEADVLIQKRYGGEGHGSTQSYRETTCKFLEEMDGLVSETGILVIFATNMPKDGIDSAVMRSGRVDVSLTLMQPILEERIALFKMYFNKFGLSDCGVNYEWIGKISYGLTGADVKKIANSLKVKCTAKVIENSFDKDGEFIMPDVERFYVGDGGYVSVCVDDDGKRCVTVEYDCLTVSNGEEFKPNFLLEVYPNGDFNVRKVLHDRVADRVIVKVGGCVRLVVSRQDDVFHGFSQPNALKNFTVEEIRKLNEPKEYCLNFDAMTCVLSVDADRGEEMPKKWWQKIVKKSCDGFDWIMELRAFRWIKQLLAKPFDKDGVGGNSDYGCGSEMDRFFAHCGSSVEECRVTDFDVETEIEKHNLGVSRCMKINLMNRKIVAFHETGHAVMSFLLKDSVLPTKACVNVSSEHLGVTIYEGDDEDLLMGNSLKQSVIKIMVLFAGRESEKLFVGEVTMGAENDYARAREIMKRILMGGALGNGFNYKECSEDVEKIMVKLNAYLIRVVDGLLEGVREVVRGIAGRIEENGSVGFDEMKMVFGCCEKGDAIQVFDVKTVIEEMVKIAKKK